MEEIKLGSRVKIKQENIYWLENSKHNPQDVEGTVDVYENKFYLTVQWDNGGHNSYSEEDLELIVNDYSYQIF